MIEKRTLKSLTKSLLFSIAFSSCCTPYHSEYVDPLYGEKARTYGHCLCQPCPPGEENKDCVVRPWLNLEYERNKRDIYKIGATFQGFTSKLVFVLGGNYIYSPDQVNGINLTLQTGAFPIRNTYTTFLGVDYNRWNKSVNSQVLSPHLGFTIPYPYLNLAQFKFGYNVGFKDPILSSGFVAINIKIPVFHFIK